MIPKEKTADKKIERVLSIYDIGVKSPAIVP